MRIQTPASSKGLQQRSSFTNSILFVLNYFLLVLQKLLQLVLREGQPLLQDGNCLQNKRKAATEPRRETSYVLCCQRARECYVQGNTLSYFRAVAPGSSEEPSQCKAAQWGDEGELQLKLAAHTSTYGLNFSVQSSYLTKGLLLAPPKAEVIVDRVYGKNILTRKQ